MNIFGKLIGAILGFLLTRHVFGIFIGAAVGHLFDRGFLSLRGLFAPPKSHAPASFLGPLFGMIGAISKSDGRVSEEEIAAVERLMTRMQLNAEQRRAAIEQFSRGKTAEFSVGLAIADLKTWCSGRRDLAFLLIDMLLEIVFAEGELARPKLELVQKLCWALRVSDRELAALALRRGYPLHGAHTHESHRAGADPGQRRPPQGRRDGLEGQDPYAVLGLAAEASDRDVTRAYRKLMSQHHPDKLAARGAPPEMQKLAEERARTINAAYERIKSARGIK